MLDTAQQAIAKTSETATSSEVKETDLPALEVEHQRLRRLLEFWRRRYQELTGRAPDQFPRWGSRNPT